VVAEEEEATGCRIERGLLCDTHAALIANRGMRTTADVRGNICLMGWRCHPPPPASLGLRPNLHTSTPLLHSS